MGHIGPVWAMYGPYNMCHIWVRYVGHIWIIYDITVGRVWVNHGMINGSCMGNGSRTGNGSCVGHVGHVWVMYGSCYYKLLTINVNHGQR